MESSTQLAQLRNMQEVKDRLGPLSELNRQNQNEANWENVKEFNEETTVQEELLIEAKLQARQESNKQELTLKMRKELIHNQVSCISSS